MVKSAKEFTTEKRPSMRGGDGTVEITSMTTREELNGKGRLFANITLKPGCSIGEHVHENESELFYIMSGSAVYNDNGTAVEVARGDVCICSPGQRHSIANNTDGITEIFALILDA